VGGPAAAAVDTQFVLGPTSGAPGTKVKVEDSPTITAAAWHRERSATTGTVAPGGTALVPKVAPGTYHRARNRVSVGMRSDGVVGRQVPVTVASEGKPGSPVVSFTLSKGLRPGTVGVRLTCGQSSAETSLKVLAPPTVRLNRDEGVAGTDVTAARKQARRVREAARGNPPVETPAGRPESTSRGHCSSWAAA
jgi:hypothetical protein